MVKVRLIQDKYPEVDVKMPQEQVDAWVGEGWTDDGDVIYKYYEVSVIPRVGEKLDLLPSWDIVFFKVTEVRHMFDLNEVYIWIEEH